MIRRKKNVLTKSFLLLKQQKTREQSLTGYGVFLLLSFFKKEKGKKINKTRRFLLYIFYRLHICVYIRALRLLVAPTRAASSYGKGRPSSRAAPGPSELAA